MAVMKTVPGPEVCNCMLFVHAIMGCDTTSSLYGIGKDRSEVDQHKQAFH